jgi:hypothetical protein
MGGNKMKTFIFLFVALLDILLLINGYKRSNALFKGIGYILLVPVIFGIGSIVYIVFIA